MNKKGTTFIKKFSKIVILLLLFLPPAILCFYWYSIEYKESTPFQNFEVRGLENITPDTANAILNLTDVWYESTKDNFPMRFNKQEYVSDFSDFESRVSESITEKLGIFSSLPYHKVCLVNRNKVYINGLLDEKQPSNVGTVAINQKNGYNFYAKRGDKDCKDVLLNKFRQSSSSPELGYPILIKINQEENEKRLNGEDYLVNLATTSVETANTLTIVSLRWWAMVLLYALLLFAWSFVFFQYEKILKFCVHKNLQKNKLKYEK